MAALSVTVTMAPAITITVAMRLANANRRATGANTNIDLRGSRNGRSNRSGNGRDQNQLHGNLPCYDYSEQRMTAPFVPHEAGKTEPDGAFTITQKR